MKHGYYIILYSVLQSVSRNTQLFVLFCFKKVFVHTHFKCSYIPLMIHDFKKCLLIRKEPKKTITCNHMFMHSVGEPASCPLELSASRVVVKLGDSVSINCSTSVDQFEGMGWEATKGGISLTKTTNHLTWTVDNLNRWDANPSCYLNRLLQNGTEDQCEVSPDVVLYSKSYFSLYRRQRNVNSTIEQPLLFFFFLQPSQKALISNPTLAG